MAWELASSAGLILVCGRYEGVDERVCHDLIDLEISTGDYVLTGGELAAMIVIDAVTRLIPGVLGGDQAAEKDSFADGLLEHAHYTRPHTFEGNEAPEVLLSGHHQEIDQWRLESSLMRTLLKRSDLLQKKDLNPREIEILKKWYHQIEKILDINDRRHKG
jgi:tRNA (guanine37-N1)-methyltransferase